MAAPRASITVSVTRAGLTLATAFALTRVFAGRSWLVVMVLAAVVPAACLDWAQRRHWHPLGRLLAVGAVGVWMSALVVDPASSVALVPTRATMTSLGDALGDATHTLRAAVVPVSPTGSALLLAFGGVFVAAVLSHWIATSLDAPVGAFAPSIALFIVVEAVGGGSWVAPTALYALAGLAYLFALAQLDLTTRRTWFHANRRRGSRLAPGGVVVGAIAVATALAVGPSVPGAGGSPILDYRSFGQGRGSASLLSAPPPILAIQDQLRLGPVRELFTVKAPRPAYWRVIALDWFTNENAWGVNRASEQPAEKLTVPRDLPPSTAMHQQFHIEQLDPHWLPAVYQPVGINLNAARVVPESLTLLVDSKRRLRDLVYDVDSRIPAPTPADLGDAPFSDPVERARDLELPINFSAPVRRLAERITRRAGTPYARVTALETFFRGRSFKYTVATNLDDSPHAIEQFLLKTRAGFCEQFAASFAAMARAVGVPARVAVGYQPGTLGVDGLYHVTNRNAHAWPEVWIEGTGWIPFEPTPGFVEPTLGLGTGRPAPPKPSTTPTSASTTTPRRTPPTLAPKSPGTIQVQQPAAKAARGHAVRNVVRGIGIALGASLLGVVGFVVIVAFTTWRRGRRRRLDRDPRRRVLGAWAEALDQLRAAGVPPRPSATALEFALRYAPAHGAGDAGPALMELARLQSAAMFALEPPTPLEASFAWEQADMITATMRHHVPASSRLRRRLLVADPRRKGWLRRVAGRESARIGLG